MRHSIGLAVLLLSSFALAAEEKAAAIGSPQQPVAVAKATTTIKVDGDGADWGTVKALPAPYSKISAGSLKLAWADDGLYGYAQVIDSKIAIDEATPWTADCIEIWLDRTGKRAAEMDENSVQIAFAPNPAAKDGKAVQAIPQGTLEGVQAMWKAIDGGYAIEFCIPAKALAPAKLAEGTKMGMNYSIDQDGAAAEQFYADKDTETAYSNPSLWGVIVLSK